MSRSRTRWIAKWTGVGACVVLLATWVMSIIWLIRFDTQAVEFLAHSGCLQFTTPNPLPSRGWGLHRRAFGELRLWGELSSVNAGGRAFRTAIVPLWVPLLALAGPTIWLWRRDRRHPAGHCRKCGYDLTGNVSGVCSECGTEVSN